MDDANTVNHQSVNIHINTIINTDSNANTSDNSASSALSPNISDLDALISSPSSFTSSSSTLTAALLHQHQHYNQNQSYFHREYMQVDDNINAFQISSTLNTVPNLPPSTILPSPTSLQLSPGSSPGSKVRIPFENSDLDGQFRDTNISRERKKDENNGPQNSTSTSISHNNNYHTNKHNPRSLSINIKSNASISITEASISSIAPSSLSSSLSSTAKPGKYIDRQDSPILTQLPGGLSTIATMNHDTSSASINNSVSLQQDSRSPLNQHPQHQRAKSSPSPISATSIQSSHQSPISTPPIQIPKLPPGTPRLFRHKSSSKSIVSPAASADNIHSHSFSNPSHSQHSLHSGENDDHNDLDSFSKNLHSTYDSSKSLCTPRSQRKLSNVSGAFSRRSRCASASFVNSDEEDDDFDSVEARYSPPSLPLTPFTNQVSLIRFDNLGLNTAPSQS